MPLAVLPRWSDISARDLHYAQPQMMQISLQIAAKIAAKRLWDRRLAGPEIQIQIQRA